MTEAEQKAQALRHERREYQGFLEHRIPELQNEGKPHPPRSSSDVPLGERTREIRENMAGSKHKGCKAREQADREWAEMKAGV